MSALDPENARKEFLDARLSSLDGFQGEPEEVVDRAIEIGLISDRLREQVYALKPDFIKAFEVRQRAGSEKTQAIKEAFEVVYWDFLLDRVDLEWLKDAGKPVSDILAEVLKEGLDDLTTLNDRPELKAAIATLKAAAEREGATAINDISNKKRDRDRLTNFLGRLQGLNIGETLSSLKLRFSNLINADRRAELQEIVESSIEPFRDAFNVRSLHTDHEELLQSIANFDDEGSTNSDFINSIRAFREKYISPFLEKRSYDFDEFSASNLSAKAKKLDKILKGLDDAAEFYGLWPTIGGNCAVKLQEFVDEFFETAERFSSFSSDISSELAGIDEQVSTDDVNSQNARDELVTSLQSILQQYVDPLLEPDIADYTEASAVRAAAQKVQNEFSYLIEVYLGDDFETLTGDDFETAIAGPLRSYFADFEQFNARLEDRVSSLEVEIRNGENEIHHNRANAASRLSELLKKAFPEAMGKMSSEPERERVANAMAALAAFDEDAVDDSFSRLRGQIAQFDEAVDGSVRVKNAQQLEGAKSLYNSSFIEGVEATMFDSMDLNSTIGRAKARATVTGFIQKYLSPILDKNDSFEIPGFSDDDLLKNTQELKSTLQWLIKNLHGTGDIEDMSEVKSQLIGFLQAFNEVATNLDNISSQDRSADDVGDEIDMKSFRESLVDELRAFQASFVAPFLNEAVYVGVAANSNLLEVAQNANSLIEKLVTDLASNESWRKDSFVDIHATLLGNFIKRIKELKADIDSKFQSLNSAEPIEKVSNVDAALKMYEAVLREHYPEDEVGPKGVERLAKMFLQEDAARIATTKSYAELAAEGSVDVSNALRSAKFRDRLIRMHYLDESGKEVRPFKGLKPSDFESFDSIKGLFRRGLVDEKNGYMVLAALKSFENRDEVSASRVELENFLKKKIAEELELEGEMHFVEAHEAVNDLFDKRLRTAETFFTKYQEHEDVRGPEFVKGKVNELSAKYKELVVLRRTGELSAEMFEMRQASLLTEAKELGIENEVRIPEVGFWSTYSNGPFMQGTRDRGINIGNYALGKLGAILKIPFTFAGKAAGGLLAKAPKEFVLPVLKGTVSAGFRYPYYLLRTVTNPFLNFFRKKDKKLSYPNIAKKVSEDTGKLGDFAGKEIGDLLSGGASNLKQAANDNWFDEKTTYKAKSKTYKERVKVKADGWKGRAEMYRNAAKDAIHVRGEDPFVNWSSYLEKAKKKAKKLKKKLKAAPANDTQQAA